MFKWPCFEATGMSRRDFTMVFTLLFNAFTWGYIIIMIMESLPLDSTTKSTFNIVFYIAASGAALSGALLSEKIRRLRFLYIWMTLGLVSSSLLIFMYNIALWNLSIVFILLGLSFGLGMPSSFAFLGDYTHTDNRGTVSSLIFLAANLITLPLAILLFALDPVVSALILTIWRGLGLIIFVILKPKQAGFEEEKKPVSYMSIFRHKSFCLYLVPWVMFTLIDALEKALLKDFFGLDFHRFILMTEPIIAVFFTFISGLLADRIGRKRMVIYGFVSLGIGYAIMGLAPIIRIAWYIYTFVDGAAAGILLTMFLFILWGDLSQPSSREKYYAIGNFPFLIRSTITALFAAFMASVPANAAFSLASFFLFLAVLPLMYAPETLPEKKMEIRRLKGYVEAAKKLREKHIPR